MGKIEIRNPDAVVTCDWLERHLDDKDLRIFDCSTVLAFDDSGDWPYRVISCRDDHDAAHIPGAGYFDLQGAFSVPDSEFAMTLSSPDAVAAGEWPSPAVQTSDSPEGE